MAHPGYSSEQEDPGGPDYDTRDQEGHGTTRAMIDAVRKLLSGEVKKAELVDEFTDDHIPCATVSLDGVQVDFCWIGSKGVGAFEFQDSKAAQKLIKHMAKEWLELEGDCEEQP